MADDAPDALAPFETGPRPPLFFLHIPKTAGTSVRHYLDAQYRAEDRCPVHDWRQIIETGAQVSGYRLIQGHFGYKLRFILPEDFRVLTLLREPMRRTISELLFIQRTPGSDPVLHELSKGLTLPQMLRRPEVMRNQHNAQAANLCLSLSLEEMSARYARSLETGQPFHPSHSEKPATLELAKSRLEAIDFVGVVENLDNLLGDVARTLGFHPVDSFPRINDSGLERDPLIDLSPDDLDILRAHNRIDGPLYEFACQLIREREAERDLRSLIERGVYKAPEGSFEILLDGVIPGSGWYRAETGPKGSWRWTGPDRRFTLDLPLREDADYRLQMLFGTAPGIEADAFSVEINGASADCRIGSEEGWRSAQVVIPRALLVRSKGLCRLRFDTGRTVSPGPGDSRQLGVSVRRIRFVRLGD
jgi:hypothetical protein